MRIQEISKRACSGENQADGMYSDKDSREYRKPALTALMRQHVQCCELGWYHEQALVPMGESFYD